MLSIDYFVEFQVEESYESLEESGGSETAEPSSGSPDEKKHMRKNVPNHKSGSTENLKPLTLCPCANTSWNELRTFGTMRK